MQKVRYALVEHNGLLHYSSSQASPSNTIPFAVQKVTFDTAKPYLSPPKTIPFAQPDQRGG